MPNEVGVLKMVTNGAITQLDEQEIYGRVLELLPGEHSVKFRFIVQGSEVHKSMEGQRITGHCEVDLVVEGAHEYQIRRSTPKSPMVNTGERQGVGSTTSTYYTFDVEVVDAGPSGKASEPLAAKCSF